MYVSKELLTCVFNNIWVIGFLLKLGFGCSGWCRTGCQNFLNTNSDSNVTLDSFLWWDPVHVPICRTKLNWKYK